ncbi:MAG: hypothetical protein GY804_09315 [Alphaproteobacteria bacterium]|nr:hypothetical protein [Alphaproteobacteria bacterium]
MGDKETQLSMNVAAHDRDLKHITEQLKHVRSDFERIADVSKVNNTLIFDKLDSVADSLGKVALSINSSELKIQNLLDNLKDLNKRTSVNSKNITLLNSRVNNVEITHNLLDTTVSAANREIESINKIIRTLKETNIEHNTGINIFVKMIAFIGGLAIIISTIVTPIYCVKMTHDNALKEYTSRPKE